MDVWPGTGKYLGPKRFLFYYLFTGIGAALVHYVVFYFEIAPVLDAIHHFQENPSIPLFKEFIDSGSFKVTSYEIQNHFNAFRIEYNDVVATDLCMPFNWP